MTPAVKRCCLRALESPDKKVQRILEEARARAWVWKSPSHIEFMPEQAKAFVTERMEALRRSGVMAEWKLELHKDSWEDYRVKIDYSYWSPLNYGPIKIAGTCSMRL